MKKTVLKVSTLSVCESLCKALCLSLLCRYIMWTENKEDENKSELYTDRPLLFFYFLRFRSSSKLVRSLYFSNASALCCCRHGQCLIPHCGASKCGTFRVTAGGWRNPSRPTGPIFSLKLCQSNRICCLARLDDARCCTETGSRI